MRDYKKELINLMSENEMYSLRSTYEKLIRKSEIYCTEIENMVARMKREQEEKQDQEKRRKIEVRRDEYYEGK